MTLQASFNLNDPDMYVTPKMAMWEAGTTVMEGSTPTADFIVPEGHFWEVVRLTASTDVATEQQARLILYNDSYYNSEYTTYSSNKGFGYYIGWQDSPQPDNSNNNPYPGSCMVFADKNLPLYLPAGTALQINAENAGDVDCYMAYNDWSV